MLHPPRGTSASSSTKPNALSGPSGTSTPVMRIPPADTHWRIGAWFSTVRSSPSSEKSANTSWYSGRARTAMSWSTVGTASSLVSPPDSSIRSRSARSPVRPVPFGSPVEPTLASSCPAKATSSTSDARTAAPTHTSGLVRLPAVPVAAVIWLPRGPATTAAPTPTCSRPRQSRHRCRRQG